ncbi:MAG: phosphopantetheine-binding protein [Nostoc sp.]|uniref:acyl carrier protein n=1 Tax=Nostoc sp. TaxID=1180 RepID=UPI002FF81A0D
MSNYLQSLVAKTLRINLSQIPTNTNLIKLGMDSLMTMEVVNQLSRDLDFMIYPREFYERPRIDFLAEYLSAELGNKDVALNSHQPSRTTLELFETKAIANLPPLTSRKERLPGIIFILSSPRSGSTLLRVMLAGHPSLFSPPELHLLPFNTMREREEGRGLIPMFRSASRLLVRPLRERDSSIAPPAKCKNCPSASSVMVRKR